MGLTRLNLERVVLFLFSILTLSSAANTSCPAYDPSIYNATGSIIFPGFEFNKYNPPLTNNNTWRLITGIFTFYPPKNHPKYHRTLTQILRLDTAAGDSTTTPQTPSFPSPYTACLTFFSRNASAAKPLPSTTIPSSPVCAGLFSSACQ